MCIHMHKSHVQSDQIRKYDIKKDKIRKNIAEM